MMNAVMPSVMMNAVKLSVIIMNAIKLSAIMMNAVAPLGQHPSLKIRLG
jgi:hypothetical protein